MRIFVFAFVVMFTTSFSHGRNLASVRKDAFTVGVNKGDSAAEYDFISEITAKMKISRFRLVAFENANTGQKLLLDGKIDAIIAKISHSPHLKNRFLVSAPYDKTEIAVAVSVKNDEIWSLADLDGKTLAFIPRDISSEQILDIWQNSKPLASQNLNDAVNFLRKGQVIALVANRQTLEAQKNFDLRIFPNKLAENNIVALFAPGSKGLQEEFDRAIKKSQPSTPSPKPEAEDRITKVMVLLDELKKELELLKRELK